MKPEWFERVSSSPAKTEREQVLKLFEDLDIAFHKYEMDVCDELCPAPSSHRDLMERLDNMIAELRKGEPE
jgi:hypothetical protein